MEIKKIKVTTEYFSGKKYTHIFTIELEDTTEAFSYIAGMIGDTDVKKVCFVQVGAEK